MNDNTKECPPLAAGRWCILRTSPGRTLALMDALGGAGFEAWTPRHTMTRARPRSRLTVDLEVPIAPTFVFVRAIHLRDIGTAEVDQASPYPAFTIFRHGGLIPLVADREIDGFRDAEATAHVARRRKKRHRYVMGQRVRVTDGLAQGMCGVVEKGGDRFALVAFGTTFRMRIATWLLSSDDIEQKAPALGAAA